MDKNQVQDQAYLDEEEFSDVEEAHDPMNAETKSVDSVDKAAHTGPKGKKRPNDKSNQENGGKAYKPVKGIVRELYAKMDTMSSEDVRALYDVLMDENFDIDEFATNPEGVLDEVAYDMSEDVADLVESEATLSEGFKAKANVIMEMAVKSKVTQEIGRLEEAYTEQLDEARDEMTSKIDSYLNYVVENWMETNELAVQTGLRTEIAETFMTGLKDLFLESYIDVPDDKVDLVDELSEQLDALEAENNKLVESKIMDAEELETFRRERVIYEMADDLADTQVDKLHKLSENVDFEDDEQFASALATIKETYFGRKTPSQQSSLNEEVGDDADDETVAPSDTMNAYVQALRKAAK
jgi:hypothetical protein